MRGYFNIISNGYLTILFLAVQVALPGQSYVKTLDHQTVSLDRKIGAFPNGDILIGDSSIEGLRDASIDGKIFLVRVDRCGAIVWSYTYHQRDVYMELRDVKVTANGTIIVYGSAFRNGFEELIYLLKVAPDGEKQGFNLFRPGTIDHFSYSIDIKNDQILCYGLLLDFDTQKQGFVSIFDMGLNFRWGVKFAPFETGGEAIFTKNGTILCRSDAFLFHLDRQGQLIWAQALNIDEVGIPLSGPLEVTDGFIFQGHRAGYSFFYKVAEDGRLRWQSDRIPAAGFGADLTQMSDGNIYVSYSVQNDDQQKLAHLILSPSGDILDQRILEIDQPTEVAESFVHLDGRSVHVVANRSLYDSDAAGLGDFLIRFSLDTLQTDCFAWTANHDFLPADRDLVFTRFDTSILSSQMILVDDTRDYWQAYETEFVARCDTNLISHDMQIDTQLNCTQDWLVGLPAGGFSWIDGNEENPRKITKAGRYVAKNESCSNPVELVYQLSRPDCRCNLYIPSAITPNGDQTNDELEIFSDCQLASIEVEVFDRWGHKIHHSSNLQSFWDGSLNGRHYPPGLYVVRVAYELIDENGNIQMGTDMQQLHLIR